MDTQYKYVSLIAPCGMNCGVCIGHMREKKPCPGCNDHSETKPKHCVICAIVNCERLAETGSKLCYECEKYPCARLRKLDTRYRTKYRMSMIENLEKIRELGFEHFLQEEEKRWDCKNCGEVVSAHRFVCEKCGMQLN